MSYSNDLVELIQQLGLNLYESRAYLALLSKGQASPRDLGEITTIPQSRTYDVLQSLKQKGFALTAPSYDRMYSPVEPEQMLATLYGRKRKEIQAQMFKIQEEIEKKLDELRVIYTRAQEKISSLKAEPNKVTSQGVFVIEGNQGIEDVMLNLIDKAEIEFLRITRPPQKSNEVLDPFYFTSGRTMERLEAAKKRGVVLRTLSIENEIPSLLGLDIKADRIVERRYLKRSEDIQEKFVLVDNRTALLNLRDPVSKTFGSLGLILESSPTCSILREHFQSMWERAESRASLAKRMKKSVEEVCETMRAAGFNRLDIAIYKKLAKNGTTDRQVFSGLVRRGTALSQITKEVDRLLKMGLLIKSEALNSVMVENPLRAMALIKVAS